jgi:hypothetical protein
MIKVQYCLNIYCVSCLRIAHMKKYDIIHANFLLEHKNAYEF